MLEFAKLLHDAFGASWPRTFIIGATLLGALLFGGTAYLVVVAARKTATRNPSEAGDLFSKKSANQTQPPPTQSTPVPQSAPPASNPPDAQGKPTETKNAKSKGKKKDSANKTSPQQEQPKAQEEPPKKNDQTGTPGIPVPECPRNVPVIYLTDVTSRDNGGCGIHTIGDVCLVVKGQLLLQRNLKDGMCIDGNGRAVESPKQP